MRLITDYKRRAEECRHLAQQMSLNEAREKLLEMAKNWVRLAAEREATLQNTIRVPDVHFKHATEAPEALTHQG